MSAISTSETAWFWREQIAQAVRGGNSQVARLRVALAALRETGEPFIPALEIDAAAYEQRGDIWPVGLQDDWQEVCDLYGEWPEPLPFQGWQGYSRLFRMEESGNIFVVGSDVFSRN